MSNKHRKQDDKVASWAEMLAEQVLNPPNSPVSEVKSF